MLGLKLIHVNKRGPRGFPFPLQGKAFPCHGIIIRPTGDVSAWMPNKHIAEQVTGQYLNQCWPSSPTQPGYELNTPQETGDRLNIKCHLPSVGIPIMETRRSSYIYHGNTYTSKDVLYIETMHRVICSEQHATCMIILGIHFGCRKPGLLNLTYWKDVTSRQLHKTSPKSDTYHIYVYIHIYIYIYYKHSLSLALAFYAIASICDDRLWISPFKYSVSLLHNVSHET